MACRDNCEVSDLVVTLTTQVGVFPLTAFANEGAVIDFSEDETEVDEKIDSEGDFYLSGMKWIKRNFSVTVNCTAEAIALDTAWKAAGPLQMCGNGVVISNCCSGATTYRSLRLESVEAPSYGTEVGTYTFNFSGVLLL